MTSELLAFHLKPITAAIKSCFSIFAIESPEKDNDQIVEMVDRSCKFMEKAHATLILNKIDLSSQRFRNYISSHESKELDYFVLAPHIVNGYSPFLINYSDDGAVKGVLVRLQRIRYWYCPKRIKEIADSDYFEALANDKPITMKESKGRVIDETRNNGNPYDVPLVNGVSDSYIYVDADNQALLAKASKSAQFAMKMLLLYLTRLPKNIDELLGESSKLSETFKDVVSFEMYSLPYTNYLMHQGDAYGAYDVSNIVKYYSQENCELCPVEATETARFTCVDDRSQSISFNNSTGLLVEKEAGASEFASLFDFSSQKSLEFKSIRVSTELPNTKQLNQYIESFPDEVDVNLSKISGTVYFDTKSVDGNVAYKIASGIDNHLKATKKIALDSFHERSFSKKDVEQELLTHFSGLLPLLHETNQLFVTLYKQANQAPSEFGHKLTAELDNS